MTVSVLLHEINGTNEAENRFIREAVSLLREAVRSAGFGGSVRKADYSSATLRGISGICRELTGDDVWERIVSGREFGQTGDHALNLAVEIVDLPGPDTGSPVIGGTRIGTLPIRSARWFLERCMTADDRINLAAHLMHQWMHVSGFVHGQAPEGRDAPSVVARLVRRALESEHGGKIDAQLTALLTLDRAACSCCVDTTSENAA